MTGIKAELVDYMGDDISVVNAARVSFDKVSEWEYDSDLGNFLLERDQNLIQFLAREKHEIPFAHTAITLRITAPIFVARQAYKHKIGFVENEISRRYVDSEPEFYVPEVWRKRADNVKQGSSDEGIRQVNMYPLSGMRPSQRSKSPDDMYREHIGNCVYLYERMIESGVCPEQARMILPQSMFTTWIWTGSLLAYSRFYNLRSHPTAQKEIRDLAELVSGIITPLYPVSWAALTRNNNE